MCRTTLLLISSVVLGSAVQTMGLAADAAKPPTPAGRIKLGVETPAQANDRFSRFKLDIPKGDPAPAASGALTIESLATMLEGLGYENKVSLYSDNSKYIDLTLSRGNWNITTSVDLSPDKSMFWLTVYLTKVEDPTKAPLTAALKLLESEAAVWPSYFTYNTKSNLIYITRPVPNGNLKATTLRPILDSFLTNIDSTTEAWLSATWNPK